MPGIAEIFVVIMSGSISLAMGYFAFRHLQKKLAPENNPTPMTYINELGGFVIFALIAIGVVVYRNFL